MYGCECRAAGKGLVSISTCSSLLSPFSHIERPRFLVPKTKIHGCAAVNMAFGILDDRILPHVPGTVHLEEQHARDAAATSTARNLKHDGAIVLAPQPSDDPNDPLNFSFAKKLTIIAILLFGAFIMPACFGPLLSAGTVVISIDLHTSIQNVTILSGYQLLIAGAWGPFVSALSRKYGKRAQFLFASLMGLVGSIICSTSRSYGMLRAGRIVQGLSFPAYESLIFATVADLFFVHQRGVFISFFGFALAAVSNLTAVVCGPITDKLGWVSGCFAWFRGLDARLMSGVAALFVSYFGCPGWVPVDYGLLLRPGDGV